MTHRIMRVAINLAVLCGRLVSASCAFHKERTGAVAPVQLAAQHWFVGANVTWNIGSIVIG